jgi:cell wall-associated NlpC family hydrolase
MLSPKILYHYIVKQSGLKKHHLKVSLLFFLPFTLVTYLNRGENNLSLTQPVSGPIMTKTDSLIEFALTFQGIPYKWGGTSPATGFDCSGFSRYVFNHFFIDLPRTAASQYHAGQKLKLNEVKKGDLLFFRGINTPEQGIGHVGIVISDTLANPLYIHASTGSGVRIDSLYKSDFKEQFLGAARILN